MATLEVKIRQIYFFIVTGKKGDQIIGWCCILKDLPLLVFHYLYPGNCLYC